MPAQEASQPQSQQMEMQAAPQESPRISSEQPVRSSSFLALSIN